MPDRASILFLCTGNSARSIMAEAIASRIGGDALRAVSAGADPKPEPHPLALATLRANAHDVEGLHSKSWEQFADERFDLVITLCGSARERCPTFPNAHATVHWDLPDPPAAPDPEEAFERVYTALLEAITILVEGWGPDLASRASDAARAIEQLYAPWD